MIISLYLFVFMFRYLYLCYMFYYIFITYLYEHHMFFNFCYIFLFSYYVILNLRDNIFVFSRIAKVVILGVNLILGVNCDTKLNLCMDMKDFSDHLCSYMGMPHCGSQGHMSKFKSCQRWSYYIPFEPTFYSE